MRFFFAVAFILATSIARCCFAQSPITVAVNKGPAASLEMEVHNGREHDIYLTRPIPSQTYVPGHVKITISRGSYPDFFRVEVAYTELPDGRIFFQVSTAPDTDSEYEIHAVDMAKGSTWNLLFSGKLSEIPTFSLGHIK
jgi:hypothetical protein